MRRLLITAGITIMLLPVHGADPAPETEQADPWNGKTRAEITALLGEPSRRKKSRGGEILTYKLVVIGGKIEPGHDVRLINVPGVGVVGKPFKSGTDGTFSLEPSGVDDEGRPLSGGIVESQRREISKDLATGEMTYKGARPEGPTPGGKIKLKFELDATGRVANWTVSGAGRPKESN